MAVIKQLISQARSNAQVPATGKGQNILANALGPSGPTVQDLAKKIAALEARVAQLEQAVCIGDDGSVVIYARANLILYAEQEVDVIGNQRFCVSSPGCSLAGSNNTFQLTTSSYVVDCATVTCHAGTVTADGSVKCDTLTAESVVAKSYSPGAGNIW